MDETSTEIAVIGGGQAALALSYHLTARGRPHVILEQGRMLESWRTKRWDSLRLIAPNWSLVMPGFAYSGAEPDAFMTKDEVVERLTGYAGSFGAPIREGIHVTGVSRTGTGGFRVSTADGDVDAARVVLATGALQRPRIPPSAASIPGQVLQLVPGDYRNPDGLPPGKVLIVGSGETGSQVSEELANAGREVLLAGGRSWWAPRRYRGRDIAAWLRLLGFFERLASDLPPGVRTGLPNPQLTGSGGGHDVSRHTLARDGVRLLGRLKGFDEGRAIFDQDLDANIAAGDAQCRALLVAIDRLIAEQGLVVPEGELPRDLRERRSAGYPGPTTLDLVAEGVSTVIWAAGYTPDLGWVDLPFLDADGYPVQRRGVTQVPGLYVLGLDWLHTAKSGLFAGIGDDAGYLSSVIVAETDQPRRAEMFSRT